MTRKRFLLLVIGLILFPFYRVFKKPIPWHIDPRLAFRKRHFVAGGSDLNSGLTPEEPLATIGEALRRCNGDGDIIFISAPISEPITIRKNNVALIGL